MRRSDACSGKNSPATVIPSRGKLVDNAVKSSCADRRDILKEYESGTNFIHESHNLEKKSAALTFQALSSSSNADVLAWEAAEDDVDPAEHVSAQGAHIVPDWSSVNVTCPHPRHKNSLRVSVLLAVCDSSDPWAERQSDSANAGE